MDIELILNRLKTAYQLTSDKEIASFLGVTPQNLSNYKARNSISWEILFTKCEQLNFNWLLFGSGEIFRNMRNNEKTCSSQNDHLRKMIEILERSLLEKDNQIAALLDIIRRMNEQKQA